jgi:spore coat protein H
MPMRRFVLLAVVLTAAPLLAQRPAGPARTAAQPTRTFTQEELFRPTKVWTAHLTFTADQWAAIQPRQAPRARRTSAEDWLQGAEGQRNGWGASQGIEFEYVHANLEFDGVLFRDVGVRFKGNGTFVSSRFSGKVPFKVDLNKYVKGQKIAGVSTLNFHNNIQDAGWMHEPIAYRLYRDAGIPSPRTAYVRLFMTVTGQTARRYLGLYSLVENVDANFLQARFKAGTGALFKPSTVNPFVDRGDAWAQYNQTYDPKTDLAEPERRRLIEFCRFVSRSTDAQFAAGIGQYVDLDAFARYLAVLIWTANPDSILERGQNYYVYLPHPAGRMIFIPWDQDDSFGRFARVLPRHYESWDIHAPWNRSVTFLNRISAVPAFRTAYLARMKEYNATIFRPERLAAQVAELAPAIRPAIREEPSRVSAFERVAAGETGLLPFARGRTQSVTQQLQGK